MSELMRKNLELGLELGSLKSLVKATAESVMLLLDTSGSMESRMGNGRTKIDALRDVVRDTRDQGRVPMIAFGGPADQQTRFVDDVPNPDGSTPLHDAIALAKTYGATRLVVISDGIPDHQPSALDQARAFGGQIDVVFVGDGDTGGYDTMGMAFMDELAKLTGGKRFEGNLSDTKKLTGQVIGLLEGEVEPTRGPIAGPGFTADDAEVGTEDDDFDEDEEEDEDDEDA